MKTIYTPRGTRYAEMSQSSTTFGRTWQQIQTTLAIAWRLFLRDISARYRQSLLGVLWAILPPLFFVGVLIVLNASGVIAVGPDRTMPYVVFAVTGIAIWGVFATGMTAGANSLTAAGSVVLRVNFPKVSLVLAAAATGLFEFLVRLPVVLLVCVVAGQPLDPIGFVLGLAALLPMFLLAVACGLILAVVSAIFHDAVHLFPILTNLLLLLSPVLYHISPDSLLGRLNRWNPISHFVITARSLLTGGDVQSMAPFWITTAAVLVLLLLAWRLFAVAQSRILERI